MWIFTPFGFFSVVSMRGNTDLLLVRGRVRNDLIAMHHALRTIATSHDLRHPSAVETNAHADYPYRCTVHRRTFVQAFTHWIDVDLTYPNFKDEVGRVDTDRAHVYHEVWAVLARAFAEERPARPITSERIR